LWAINTLIVAAFFVGSLVRFHAAFFCLLALLPLVALIKPRPAIRFALSQMTTLMVAVAISAAAAAYNVSYYARSPGWENFWKDASARASAWQYTTLDRSRPDEIQFALSAARWTMNDYALLSNWLYMDPTLFSNDRVVAFAEHVPQAPKLLRIGDTYDALANADSRLPLFAFLCFVLRRLCARMCLFDIFPNAGRSTGPEGPTRRGGPGRHAVFDGTGDPSIVREWRIG
jgi:hypothetical protein